MQVDCLTIEILIFIYHINLLWNESLICESYDYLCLTYIFNL